MHGNSIRKVLRRFSLLRQKQNFHRRLLILTEHICLEIIFVKQRTLLLSAQYLPVIKLNTTYGNRDMPTINPLLFCS